MYPAATKAAGYELYWPHAPPSKGSTRRFSLGDRSHSA